MGSGADPVDPVVARNRRRRDRLGVHDARRGFDLRGDHRLFVLDLDL